MRVLFFICFCMLCGISAADGVPQGTVRTIPGAGRSESYYGSRGEFLGRSVPNNQGGRTYTNQYESSARSVQTYNGGQKFTRTTPPNNPNGLYRKPTNYGSFNQRPSRNK